MEGLLFTNHIRYTEDNPHSDADVTALTPLQDNQLHPDGSIPYSDPDVTAITSMHNQLHPEGSIHPSDPDVPSLVSGRQHSSLSKR